MSWELLSAEVDVYKRQGYILEKIIYAMRLEFVLGKNIWRFEGENK